ncbi:MAG: RidA family protein [Pseudomonadota bacterium]
MSETIQDRLAKHGITLPEASAPLANYVPAKRHGNLLLTSGQLPLNEGKLAATGILGADVDVPTGQEAAKWCALNILVQANAALGSLETIAEIVKITIFVASAPTFTEQHVVGNGASDFLVDILGDAGKHARSAVGVPSLPMNAPVEIEAIIAVKD